MIIQKILIIHHKYFFEYFFVKLKRNFILESKTCFLSTQWSRCNFHINLTILDFKKVLKGSN
jgi:hypothetical protein